MNYQEWIEQQIVNHQREVAKYEIALEVIRAANKVLHPPKPKAIAAPKAKEERAKRGDGVNYRGEILEFVSKHGPMTSGALIDRLKLTSKIAKQRVYNSLSHLRIAGNLDKDDETGIYTIHEPVKINGTNG